MLITFQAQCTFADGGVYMPRPRRPLTGPAAFAATRFKHWRERTLHMRQDELAKILGCSQSRISLIERGKRVPDDAFFAQLQKLWGVPRRAFFGTGDGQP
jgi:DNA-binding XRE family transcriptional regulator